MLVLIPSPLRSYTRGAAEAAGEGTCVGTVVDSIERQFPGLRFRMIDEQDRIRPHIQIFVGEEKVRALAHPVRATDRVQIVCALSGG